MTTDLYRLAYGFNRVDGCKDNYAGMARVLANGPRWWWFDRESSRDGAA